MSNEQIDLGPCCACRKTGTMVRNIMMLPFRAPMPGTGWGCLVCELPSNGAVAVVCDDCLDTRKPILDVCHGYPAAGMRMSKDSLIDPFDHNPARHADEQYYPSFED